MSEQELISKLNGILFDLWVERGRVGYRPRIERLTISEYASGGFTVDVSVIDAPCGACELTKYLRRVSDLPDYFRVWIWGCFETNSKE